MRLVKFPAKKASPTAKESVLKLLEQLKKEREIDSLFVVTKRADGNWIWHFVGTAATSDMIGRIEVAKVEIVKSYLDNPHNATVDS